MRGTWRCGSDRRHATYTSAGVSMGSPDLLLICVSSFAAVFLLLSALALVMRALIALFPQRTGLTDTAMLAAVAAAVSAAHPGAAITRIEETP